MTALETARGLSEAQREALILWEDRAPDPDRLRAMMEALRPGEIEQMREMGLATKPRLWKRESSVLTPFGLQVRALLKDNTNGNG